MDLFQLAVMLAEHHGTPCPETGTYGYSGYCLLCRLTHHKLQRGFND